MNYVVVGILSIVFLSGCSIKNFVPNKLDSSAFKSIEEKFEDMDKLECKNLQNKKVFVQYTTNQHGVYKELLDLSQTPMPIEYDGDYAVHFKGFVKNILVKYCHSQIVETKQSADVVIDGNIKKYFVQITKFNSTENGQDVKVEAKAILEVDTKINNIEFPFGHVLEAKRNASVIGVDLTLDSVLKYDDYSSPFAIMALTTHFGGFSVETGGIVKTYDVNGNEIKKVNLSTADIGLIIKDDEKQDIANLYDMNGYLKLLMYRYIKDLSNFTTNEI